jgi:predicted RNA-binding protein
MKKKGRKKKNMKKKDFIRTPSAVFRAAFRSGAGRHVSKDKKIYKRSKVKRILRKELNED